MQNERAWEKTLPERPDVGGREAVSYVQSADARDAKPALHQRSLLMETRSLVNSKEKDIGNRDRVD